MATLYLALPIARSKQPLLNNFGAQPPAPNCRSNKSASPSTLPLQLPLPLPLQLPIQLPLQLPPQLPLQQIRPTAARKVPNMNLAEYFKSLYMQGNGAPLTPAEGGDKQDKTEALSQVDPTTLRMSIHHQDQEALVTPAEGGDKQDKTEAPSQVDPTTLRTSIHHQDQESLVTPAEGGDKQDNTGAPSQCTTHKSVLNTGALAQCTTHISAINTGAPSQVDPANLRTSVHHQDQEAPLKPHELCDGNGTGALADLRTSIHHQDQEAPLKPHELCDGNGTGTLADLRKRPYTTKIRRPRSSRKNYAMAMGQPIELCEGSDTEARRLPQPPQVVLLRGRTSQSLMDFGTDREISIGFDSLMLARRSEGSIQSSSASNKQNGSESRVEEADEIDEVILRLSVFLPIESPGFCPDSPGSSRPSLKVEPKRIVYRTSTRSVTSLLGSLPRDDEDECQSLTADSQDKESYKPLIQKVQEGLRREVAPRSISMPQMRLPGRLGPNGSALSNGADGGKPRPEKRRLWLATHLRFKQKEEDDRKMRQERMKAAEMDAASFLDA
eukprot:gene25573-11224_t